MARCMTVNPRRAQRKSPARGRALLPDFPSTPTTVRRVPRRSDDTGLHSRCLVNSNLFDFASLCFPWSDAAAGGGNDGSNDGGNCCERLHLDLPAGRYEEIAYLKTLVERVGSALLELEGVRFTQTDEPARGQRVAVLAVK